jgi:hypothetical protein
MLPGCLSLTQKTRSNSPNVFTMNSFQTVSLTHRNTPRLPALHPLHAATFELTPEREDIDETHKPPTKMLNQKLCQPDKNTANPTHKGETNYSTTVLSIKAPCFHYTLTGLGAGASGAATLTTPSNSSRHGSRLEHKGIAPSDMDSSHVEKSIRLTPIAERSTNSSVMSKLPSDMGE